MVVLGSEANGNGLFSTDIRLLLKINSKRGCLYGRLASAVPAKDAQPCLLLPSKQEEGKKGTGELNLQKQKRKNTPKTRRLI